MGFFLFVQMVVGCFPVFFLFQPPGFLLPDGGIGFSHIGPVVVPVPAYRRAVQVSMVLLAQVHQDHLFWLDALFLQFLGQRRQIQDGRLAAAAHPVGIIHPPGPGQPEFVGRIQTPHIALGRFDDFIKGRGRRQGHPQRNLAEHQHPRHDFPNLHLTPLLSFLCTHLLSTRTSGRH